VKIVKLTESDLARIVERVLNEQVQEVTNFDKDYDYKKEGDNFFFKLKVSPVSEKAKGFKSQGKFLNWTKATGAGLEAIKTKVFKEIPRQTTTTTTTKPSSVEKTIQAQPEQTNGTPVEKTTQAQPEQTNVTPVEKTNVTAPKSQVQTTAPTPSTGEIPTDNF
jgi:hypothetical protein